MDFSTYIINHIIHDLDLKFDNYILPITSFSAILIHMFSTNINNFLSKLKIGKRPTRFDEFNFLIVELGNSNHYPDMCKVYARYISDIFKTIRITYKQGV